MTSSGSDIILEGKHQSVLPVDLMNYLIFCIYTAGIVRVILLCVLLRTNAGSELSV